MYEGPSADVESNERERAACRGHTNARLGTAHEDAGTDGRGRARCMLENRTIL
jgi:hypothetical protein